MYKVTLILLLILTLALTFRCANFFSKDKINHEIHGQWGIMEIINKDSIIKDEKKIIPLEMYIDSNTKYMGFSLDDNKSRVTIKIKFTKNDTLIMTCQDLRFNGKFAIDLKKTNVTSKGEKQFLILKSEETFIYAQRGIMRLNPLEH